MKMNRNVFWIAGLLAVFHGMSAHVADAQQLKVPRVGFLALAPFVPPKLFLEDLEKLGFVDGKNVAIEYRFANGRHDRMRALAAELVRSNVDVIVANGDQAVTAAMAETKTIPIVMLSCDALAVGFVSSLARPGRNVTGVTCMSIELSSKRVEVFKQILPGLSNIAVIYNPENVAKPFDAKNTIAAAEKLGIKGHTREVREIEDLEPAFASAAAAGANGVIVLSEALTLLHKQSIVDLALKYRLPDMHVFREFVDAGGLASYGPNVQDMLRQIARHLGKVLKGENPGELPVEQPTTFDFVINLKRAKALGLDIPSGGLVQATNVLE
jgi:putative tryptophan/tyrosine transport system substrate-binding protein